MAYISFLIAGVVAGICAGLFGVGGGLVIVPILLVVFAKLGYAPEIIAHLAVGTSLATIVVTSVSSMQSHHKRGGVRWQIFQNMAIGLVVGSLFGAYVASFLASKVLTGLIGGMALIMGIKMLLAKASQAQHLRPLPKAYMQTTVGGLIGAASAIFGIGGGSLTVPFLSRYVDMKQAVGTSSACGLPIALAGAIGFMIFGQKASVPQGAIGFVHIGAFVCISIMSFIFAKVGAKIAHSLPSATLKKAFGGLLVIVAIKMISGVV